MWTNWNKSPFFSPIKPDLALTFTAYEQRTGFLLGSLTSCYNTWKSTSSGVPFSGWFKWYDNFSADTQCALEAVARLQAKLKERGETPAQGKLSLLKIVLQSPLFHHILSLQQAQQKPLAKVEREHGCVGVGCIVNARKGAGIMSKKIECWNQTGWVISLPKLITKASRKREIGSEQREVVA